MQFLKTIVYKTMILKQKRHKTMFYKKEVMSGVSKTLKRLQF